MNSVQITPADLLHFWFSEEARPKWFKPDQAFDETLRRCFGAAYEAAADGALDTWHETAQGALAWIILLDQVPRNLYRNTPRAFATDDLALAAAKDAVSRGLDQALTPEERVFLYMPFMHSESLADQDRGVQLYESLGRPENLDYMRRHRDIIAGFGRFPHRNAILARDSTPEEVELLKDPNAWF